MDIRLRWSVNKHGHSQYRESFDWSGYKSEVADMICT